MEITCIADLPGHYPKLEGGDLLIVAGNLTATDEEIEYVQFDEWLKAQNYRCKIVIAGNHDSFLEEYSNDGGSIAKDYIWSAIYLQDSGTEFEGLKVWGSPWTLKFDGMNPRCMAFTCDTEEKLASKYALIPADTDILVTHGPPYLHSDRNVGGANCGSRSLNDWVRRNLPKLIVCGHIHEAYGKCRFGEGLSDGPLEKWVNVPDVYNCSHVNERYEPVNAPIRVVL